MPRRLASKPYDNLTNLWSASGRQMKDVKLGLVDIACHPERAHHAVKWSQKTGQLAKVYPKPMKGYENGEAPEFYRSV